MSLKANPTHIMNGTKEQITKLLDSVAQNQDANKAKLEAIEQRMESGETGLEEIRTNAQKQKEVIDLVEERLRNLDSMLEQGSKFYKSINPDPSAAAQAAREAFARNVLDIAAVSMHQKPRFGGEIFLSQTEATAIAPDSGDQLGGFLVPDEQRAEIIRVVERYGVARRLCRVFPMAGKTLRLPTNSDLPEVYWDTQIGTGPPNTKELFAPPESKITFLRPEMTAHKLIAIDTLSIEVDQDSIPPLASFLVDVFGIAVAKEEDFQCLVSDGLANEPFTGILNVANIPAVTGSANTFLATLQATGATGGYNKLLAVMDAADEDASEFGTWVFSNSILNGIRQVKDLDEQPLFGQMTGGAPNTLFGRPYLRSRIMPKISDAVQASKPFIIFGNFDYHIMGDRMRLSIDVSPHAAFKEAGLVMRVMERIAFQTALVSPFAILKAAA